MTFSEANRVIYTGSKKEEEAEKAFDIKTFTSICEKCDRKEKCYAREDRAMQCNFFRSSSKIQEAK